MCVAVIALAACRPIPGDAGELAGTRWRLMSIDGGTIIHDSYILLEITAGVASGSAGCNRYRAELTINPGNRLEIGEIESTEEACITPAGIMEQEEVYLDHLSQVTVYRFEQGRLVLGDNGDHSRLVYEPIPQFNADPDQVLERVWHLKSVTPIRRWDPELFTIIFNLNQFSGTTSCRDYTGTYFTQGDQITITSIQMTTDVECSQVDALAESDFTTFLSNLEQYSIDQGQLTLYTRRGEELEFQESPPQGTR